MADESNSCQAPDAPASGGQLVAVGLGIRLGQLTLEAKDAIETAEVVFTVTNNVVSEFVLARLNPNIVDLQPCYEFGKPRMQTYEEMIALVLAEVRAGKKVCFAVYGHAGVFAYPTHTSIARAKEEGFLATMLPGISAEDCIFADLGIDPAPNGCQSFDATDFVLRERIWDPFSTLVLWQVSVAGIVRLPEEGEVAPGCEFLFKVLIDAYGPDHLATLYEAPPYPLCGPRKDEVALGDLRAEMFRPQTTMVIRPLRSCPRRNEAFAELIR